MIIIIVATYFAFLIFAWWVYGGALALLCAGHIIARRSQGEYSKRAHFLSLAIPTLAIGAAVAYMLYTQCYVENVMERGQVGKSGTFAALYGVVLGVVPASLMAGGIWKSKERNLGSFGIGLKLVPLGVLPLFYAFGFAFSAKVCGSG